jgi:hypothetical protein
MKKIIFAFSILILGLTSCSKNESSTTSSSLILPKKIVYEKTTTSYTYNGNKILTATTPSFNIGYTYDGDLVSKIEIFDKNSLITILDYSYESNKLKSEISTRFQGGEIFFKYRKDYVYNSEGVFYEEYEIEGNNEMLVNTCVLTIVNGSVVKKEVTNASLSNVTTTVYEYDTKNNIFKNVLGFNKLISEPSSFSSNNITKEEVVSTDNTNGVSKTIYKNISEYTYNSNRFPVTQKTTDDGSIITSTIVY